MSDRLAHCQSEQEQSAKQQIILSYELCGQSEHLLLCKNSTFQPQLYQFQLLHSGLKFQIHFTGRTGIKYLPNNQEVCEYASPS